MQQDGCYGLHGPVDYRARAKRSVNARPASATSSGGLPGGMLKITPSSPASKKACTWSHTASGSPTVYDAAGRPSAPRLVARSSLASASPFLVALTRHAARVMVLSV